MENNASQQFLKDNKIIPFISFADRKVHKIIVVKDKLDQLTDKTGKTTAGVSYLVKEFGQPAKFFTSSVGLIQKLSRYVGMETEVAVEMKSKKTDKGYQNYYKVDEVGKEEAPMAESEDDIPVIEDTPVFNEAGNINEEF
jgi:hypothetical protein